MAAIRRRKRKKQKKTPAQKIAKAVERWATSDNIINLLGAVVVPLLAAWLSRPPRDDWS